MICPRCGPLYYSRRFFGAKLLENSVEKKSPYFSKTVTSSPRPWCVFPVFRRRRSWLPDAFLPSPPILFCFFAAFFVARVFLLCLKRCFTCSYIYDTETAARHGFRQAGRDGPHAEEAPQGRPQGAHLLADDHAPRHPRGLPPTPVRTKEAVEVPRDGIVSHMCHAFAGFKLLSVLFFCVSRPPLCLAITREMVKKT